MAQEEKTANGFVFHNVNAEALLSAIKRALTIYKNPKQWQQICKTAMQQELSWESSAKKYQALYEQ